MTRWNTGDRLVGNDARTLLREQIEEHSAGLHAALAKFDPQSAFSSWFETIRAVEEFINLPCFGLKEPWLWEALLDLPLDVTQAPRRFRVVHHHIVYQFGAAFAQRFTRLMVQAMAVGVSFAMHRIETTRGRSTRSTRQSTISSPDAGTWCRCSTPCLMRRRGGSRFLSSTPSTSSCRWSSSMGPP
jgi:hypothetical protein